MEGSVVKDEKVQYHVHKGSQCKVPVWGAAGVGRPVVIDISICNKKNYMNQKVMKFTFDILRGNPGIYEILF